MPNNPAKTRFLEWDVDHQQPLDCPMCGALRSFDINPANPAEGYCHKEETIWTVKPGKPLAEIKATAQFATMKLDDVQRHEQFWKYVEALNAGDFDGIEEGLRYAQMDAGLERHILLFHKLADDGLPKRPTPQNIMSRFIEKLVDVKDAIGAWKAYNKLWKQKQFYEEVGDKMMLTRLVHVVVDAYFSSLYKPSLPIRDAYLTFLLRWLGFTVYEDCPDCKHTVSAHGDNGCTLNCTCSRPKYGFFYYVVWELPRKESE